MAGGLVDAAGSRVARIGRTVIVVATSQGSPGSTHAVLTEVIFGAGILVIAAGLIEVVGTAGSRVAHVVGAGITIVTPHLGSFADSVLTHVRNGTGITIIAGNRVVSVLAPIDGIAPIVGTGVVVLTVQRVAWIAQTVTTDFRTVAHIVVVAYNRVVGKGTARSRITTVVGAQVVIVADDLYAQARTVRANILLGALVGVGARDGVVDIKTPGNRVTGIVGAKVVVSTVQRLAS